MVNKRHDPEFVRCISKRIKDLRLMRDITIVRASIDLDMYPETIYKYEKGRALPSLESLLKISKYYNVSVDYLLGAETLDLEKLKEITNKFSVEIARLTIEQQYALLDFLRSL